MQHNKTNNIPKIKITPDISDFESDIDIDDLSQDFWHFILTKRRFLVFVSFPFSIVWLVLILYFYFNLIADSRSNVDQISEHIFAAAFAPLLVTTAAFVRIKLQFRDTFYEQFASLSNFDFHRLGNGVSICSLGTIFKVFPDCVVKDVVCGKFFSRDMNMFVYESSKSNTSSITIMEVNIATLLPNILLVNKKSRLAGPLTKGFNHSGKPKAIILEGDFNQHFALYGNENCNIEILQIFSPDFMQLLIDSSMEYSIEFCGLTMFIYSNKVVTKRTQLFDMLNLAKILTTELMQVANRLADDDMLALNPIIIE
ncbi:MAG: hypothetical protein PHW82_12845 [Bacteroidales bacterium]|nr:hypothetical protein [Bacteroidales bacterium]